MVTDAFVRTTLLLYHIPANLFIYSFDMPRQNGRKGGGAEKIYVGSTQFVFCLIFW